MSNTSDHRARGGRRNNRNDRGQRRHTNQDMSSETDERLRELDADNDPISLAEEIAKEGGAVKPPQNGAVKTANKDDIPIVKLQQMNIEELTAAAKSEGIELNGQLADET